MAGEGEFDESKHPRDHGKFSESAGAGGSSITDAHRERAKQSLNDASFVRDHMGRLTAAGDEARANFPAGERAGDAAHNAAQAAIHEEAARAIVEHEAHGGDSYAWYAASQARNAASDRDATMAEHHESAMQAIAAHKEAIAEEQRTIENEDRAIAAGHISTEPSGVVERLGAEQEAHGARGSEHMARLEQAHQEAAAALSVLHSHEREGDEERGIPGVEFNHTHELGAMFDQTHSAHEGEGGTESKHSFEDMSLARGGGQFREGAIPAHPDSDEFETRHPHPDSEDYTFRHEHPNEANSPDHPHPDSESYQFEHPHPDDVEGVHTTEQHAQLLSAHESEHATALSAHEQAVTAHEREHAEALANHHAERSAALAAHNAALDAHKSEIAHHAEAAQSALERLHEHQAAAHEGLKEVESASKASRTAAGKALDKYDEHDLVTPKVTGDDLERARAASASYLSAQRDAVDNADAVHYTDTKSGIKDEQRKTASAIKELSKITGRAPRLPEKTSKPKKSASPVAKLYWLHAAVDLLRAVGVELPW